MKPWKRSLAFLLLFLLLLGAAASAHGASKGTGHYKSLEYDYYIFPRADVIDAAVVQGESRLLHFASLYTRGSSSDYFCAAIYRGSTQTLAALPSLGMEPEVMDFFYVNATEFNQFLNHQMTFRWNVDSRYTVGDYCVVCYMMDAETGHIYNADELFWTDLHVVSAESHAEDMSIQLMKDIGFVPVEGDSVIDMSPERTAFFLAVPEPSPCTDSLDCAVYATPSVVVDTQMRRGYLQVQTLSEGMAHITLASGTLQKSFWIKVGNFNEAKDLKIFHKKTALCVGETDECVVRSKLSIRQYPTGAVWTSSDPEVVSVGTRGEIRALKPGRAEITAVAGRFRETVEYTVQYHTLPEDTPVSVRTATQPARSVGRCSTCGKENAENIYEPAVFSDTDAAAWYARHVDKVYALGLMKGVGAHTFSPDASVTRGMAATVLYRIAGMPEVDPTTGFKDVDPNRYYAEAVIWAREKGVVKGYPDGTFRPDENITREQLAAILCRYAAVCGIGTSAGADLLAFPDGNEVHNYAKKALAWAVSEKLITGVGVDGKTFLQPTNNATRAQFATVISRFLSTVQPSPEDQV